MCTKVFTNDTDFYELLRTLSSTMECARDNFFVKCIKSTVNQTIFMYLDELKQSLDRYLHIKNSYPVWVRQLLRVCKC